MTNKTEITYTGIDQVKISDIAEVYNGRPGCGCGCRGSYSKDEEAKFKMLALFRRYPAKLEFADDNGRTIVSMEHKTAYRWMYLKRHILPKVEVK